MFDRFKWDCGKFMKFAVREILKMENMNGCNKIFGIGMSKTGTSTLKKCFLILGLTPHTGGSWRLVNFYKKGDYAALLKVAKGFKSFQDTPWFKMFKELDQAFPNSKFILTVRKDSLTHAKSGWAHMVRKGSRDGQITPEFIKKVVDRYEQHNQAVKDHFRDRPDDLLVVRYPAPCSCRGNVTSPLVNPFQFHWGGPKGPRLSLSGLIQLVA